MIFDSSNISKSDNNLIKIVNKPKNEEENNKLYKCQSEYDLITFNNSEKKYRKIRQYQIIKK